MDVRDSDQNESRLEDCEVAIEESDLAKYGSIVKNQNSSTKPNKGATRTPESKYLLRIGPAPNVARFQEEPRSYMTNSVLVAIFCFIPLGILAARQSLQVHKRFTRGDLYGARKASQRSRTYFQAGFVLGVLLWVVGLLVLLSTLDKL